MTMTKMYSPCMMLPFIILEIYKIRRQSSYPNPGTTSVYTQPPSRLWLLGQRNKAMWHTDLLQIQFGWNINTRPQLCLHFQSAKICLFKIYTRMCVIYLCWGISHLWARYACNALRSERLPAAPVTYIATFIRRIAFDWSRPYVASPNKMISKRKATVAYRFTFFSITG